MGHSQICWCPFHEPWASEIAHLISRYSISRQGGLFHTNYVIYLGNRVGYISPLYSLYIPITSPFRGVFHRTRRRNGSIWRRASTRCDSVPSKMRTRARRELGIPHQLGIKWEPGVSINGGSPKQLLKTMEQLNITPKQNWWFGGTPILGKLHILDIIWYNWDMIGYS